MIIAPLPSPPNRKRFFGPRDSSCWQPGTAAGLNETGYRNSQGESRHSVRVHCPPTSAAGSRSRQNPKTTPDTRCLLRNPQRVRTHMPRLTARFLLIYRTDPFSFLLIYRTDPFARSDPFRSLFRYIDRAAPGAGARDERPLGTGRGGAGPPPQNQPVKLRGTTTAKHGGGTAVRPALKACEPGTTVRLCRLRLTGCCFPTYCPGNSTSLLRW